MNTLISSIEGNRQKLDGGAMFGNAPRPVWEKWIWPDELGRIPLACRALLIEHAGKKILCETGIGAFFEPKLAERFGVQEPGKHLLIENLAEMGLSDKDIDFVILSHLHFDHAGGLLKPFQDGASQELLFPNAQYIVGSEAWMRACHPHPRDRASYIPQLTELLKASGRLILVESEIHPKVFPEHIRFVISHGHTPGQMLTVFKGDHQTVFFAGDLIPGTPWVHLPITMGYDRYPEMLIDEKALLYQQAAPEHWLIFYTHDPEIVASQVIQDEKGRFKAHNPLTHLQRKSI